MKQGICIDASLSTILKETKTYFLQDIGNENYYVSRFNNTNSYFGIFSKKRFKLIEPEKSTQLDLFELNN